MKLLALFAPAVVMSSYIFDTDVCNADTCTSSGETITQICGENGNNDYNCLCNKMPDTFYAEMLNCTRSCGVSDDFDDASNAQDVKSYYCKLETQTSASAASAAGSSTASGSSSGSSSSSGLGSSNHYVSLVGLVAALLI